jgi:hypothetical protein
MGFAQWVKINQDELRTLGKGYHYGEWWGNGIQRGYGLPKGEKRFSLFNTGRWVKKEGYDCLSLTEGCFLPILKEKQEYCPECCHVVPILYNGIFDMAQIEGQLDILKTVGSKTSPGFMNPEGIVIYHVSGNLYFKKTILNDEKGKEQNETHQS